MAKSVNKATLIGNVGQDPKVNDKVTAAMFTIATNDRRKVGDDWEDVTEWHDVKAFGKLAEVVDEYVKKGKTVYIEGKIQTESWEDRESGAKRSRKVIIVNDLVLLGGKEGGSRGDRDEYDQRREPANSGSASKGKSKRGEDYGDFFGN